MTLTFLEVPEEDKVPMLLTVEQTAAIRAKVKTIQQELQSIAFFLDNDGLTREMARAVTGVTESRMVELGQLIGVDTEAAARIEQRSGDLRRANLRVHELERLLGEAQPLEAVLPTLRTLKDHLYRWWQLEGFGHVSEASFGEYTAKVEFSCMSFGRVAVLPAGATRQERKALWRAAVEAQGFVLVDADGEKGVQDCPQTREALRALFARRLPGAHISRFISRESRKAGSVLQSVEVYIYNLAPIRELPVPPADAEEID